MTRVTELWDAGVNIGFGQDCVMDPWYAFGMEDMLDVAHMAIHFGRLLSERRKAQVFDGITYGGARALNLAGYGLEPDCRADMVQWRHRVRRCPSGSPAPLSTFSPKSGGGSAGWWRPIRSRHASEPTSRPSTSS